MKLKKLCIVPFVEIGLYSVVVVAVKILFVTNVTHAIAWRIKMKYEQFEEEIFDFIQEFIEVTGCRECHETGNSELQPFGEWKAKLKEIFKGVQDEKRNNHTERK